MKNLKIITLFIAVFLFTSVPFSAEAKDCSEFKKLTPKWTKCKLDLSILKKTKTTKTDKKIIESKTLDDINEKCKTLVDCFLNKRKK